MLNKCSYIFSETTALLQTKEGIPDLWWKSDFQNKSSANEDDLLMRKLVNLIENDSPDNEIVKVLPEISKLDKFYEGWSPLHYAVVANREDVCEMLIQRGADVNIMAEEVHSAETLNYGLTPFSISCSRVSHMAIFEMLLKNGGDVNTVEPISGNTPLTYTVKSIDFHENSKCSIKTQHEKMEQLVKYGANPNKRTSLGLTLLHFFDLHSENEKEEELALDMMNTMIQKYKLDVNANDGTGLTPIMVACQNLRAKRIDLLIRLGANLDNVVAKNGWSVVHMLSGINDPDYVTNYEKRFAECFEVLLKAEFNIHKTSFTGNTILHELCTGVFNLNVVGICLKYGLELDQKNIFGNTPLHSCLLYNNEMTYDLKIHEQEIRKQLTTAKFLLSKRSDVNSKDINGMTPLMTASRKNLPASVSFIIENGGSINESDKCGRTALHHCILAANKQEEFITVLKLLLEANIDVTKRDHNGYTANYYTIFLDEIRRQKASQYLSLYDENSSFIFQNKQWSIFQKERERFEELFTISESSNASFKEFPSEEKNRVLKDLLYAPGIGTIETIAESSKLKNQINSLMQQFCNALSSSDSPFKYKILLSGGVAEGTKVGLPDEYDYLLVVENLLGFIPEETDNTGVGFVKLKYKGQNKMSFLVTDGYLDTSKFTTYFRKVAFDMLGRLETLKRSDIYIIGKNYGNEGNCEQLQNSANFIIFLRCYSQCFGEIDLSIDIVPVYVFPREWWPKNTNDSLSLTVLKNEQNFCASLMKAKGHLFSDLNQLRISTSLIETRIIKSLPSFMRHAYMIMKILKEVCTDEELGPYRYYMDTYRLKNALLKHVQIHFPDLDDNEYCDKTIGQSPTNKEIFSYANTLYSLKELIVQANGSSFCFKKLEREMDMFGQLADARGALFLCRLYDRFS